MPAYYLLKEILNCYILFIYAPQGLNKPVFGQLEKTPSTLIVFQFHLWNKSIICRLQIERFNIDSKQNKSSSTVTRCNVQNEKNNLKQVNHTLFHYRRRHGKRLIVQLVHPILQGNPKRKLSEILPKSLIDPPDPFTRNLIACTLLNSIVCFQR